MYEDGQVEVRDKVSPRRPYPTIIGCNQDHDADTCEVRVPHDSRVYNLTCVMEQVKPAVELRWIHLFLGGKTVLNAFTTVLLAYTGSWLRTNTYTTSASIQVEAVDDAVYECEAVGVAVGGSSARTRVRLTTIHPSTLHSTTIQPTSIKPITATDRDVHSTNNPGTTLVLTHEVPPIANEFDAWHIGLIVALVLLVLLLNGFAFFYAYQIWRRDRARTVTYNAVPTTSSNGNFPAQSTRSLATSWSWPLLNYASSELSRDKAFMSNVL